MATSESSRRTSLLSALRSVQVGASISAVAEVPGMHTYHWRFCALASHVAGLGKREEEGGALNEWVGDSGIEPLTSAV